MQIIKRVELDFLGERYKGSYINVYSVSVKERAGLLGEIDKLGKDPKKQDEFVIDLVTARFVDGELVDDGKSSKITIEALQDFPAQVFIEITSQLQGRISPNS